MGFDDMLTYEQFCVNVVLGLPKVLLTPEQSDDECSEDGDYKGDD